MLIPALFSSSGLCSLHPVRLRQIEAAQVTPGHRIIVCRHTCMVCLADAGRIVCRSSEFAAAKESFDQKFKRQQAVLRPLQPSVLIDSLSKAAAKADEDSDALCEKFSAGGCTVDSFLAQYVKARTLYHQRELKCQAAQQTL